MFSFGVRALRGHFVFFVGSSCMGIQHIPHEVLAKVPPALCWPRLGLMLLHQPSVSSASERYCIHASEWSTFAISLSAQRGYARFNLGLPTERSVEVFLIPFKDGTVSAHQIQ
jgi:hypothetical protein